MYIRTNGAVIKREDFLFSANPVIESRKDFWVQKKFLFHVLIWSYELQKKFGANDKVVN